MKRLITLSTAVFFALLTGCANMDKQAHPDTYVYAPPDKDVQNKLAEAAASISDSLNDLASIEQSLHPDTEIPLNYNPASVNMEKQATIQWHGPLKPLVQKIANASDYQLKTLGNQPPIPPIVTINAKQTQLLDILRDAQFQSQNKARIRLKPSSHIIELRYEASSNS